MFKGSYVAMVTPFKNGKVDDARLKWLVDFQIEQGTEGLVPCGSTGESATLVARGAQARDGSGDQGRARPRSGPGRGRLQFDVGSAGAGQARRPCRAPTGRSRSCPITTSPPRRASLSISSRSPGRPNCRSSSTTFPDAPALTCRWKRWSSSPRPVRRSSASRKPPATMDYTSQLLTSLGRDRFIVFSGDDSLTLPLLSLGARGVISVLANILPGPMVEMCGRWENGNVERRSGSPSAALPAHAGAVCGDQSHSDQGRDGAVGALPGRDAPAARPHIHRKPEEALGGPGRLPVSPKGEIND